MWQCGLNHCAGHEAKRPGFLRLFIFDSQRLRDKAVNGFWCWVGCHLNFPAYWSWCYCICATAYVCSYNRTKSNEDR